MTKKFIVLFAVTVLLAVLPLQTQVRGALSFDVTEPRYVETAYYGTYEAITNKVYQLKSNGSKKLVLSLGEGTSAYNTVTGENITDWRSFYITDLDAGFFYEGAEECILISGLLCVADPNQTKRAVPADVFILYFPQSGGTRTLHINFRYSVGVKNVDGRVPDENVFDYLDELEYQHTLVFPRGKISDDGSGNVYVLSGGADLNALLPDNKKDLENNGYGSGYWEIVEIQNAYPAPNTYGSGEAAGDTGSAFSKNRNNNTQNTDGIRIESLFYGPVEVFESYDKIPELASPDYRHKVDPRLIVFRTDDYENFTVASVGTGEPDETNVCTALNFNRYNKDTGIKETYYWIYRDEFLELAGMDNALNM